MKLFSPAEPLLAFVIAAVTGVLFGLVYVPFLRSRQWRKEARIDTPATHQAKAGTPSMGGVIILVGTIVACAFAARSTVSVLLILMLILFGGLGFWDDYTKAVGRSGHGLKARQKLVLQVLLAGFAVWYLVHSGDIQPTLHWPGVAPIKLGGWFYLFAVAMVIGASNATNITDGLDGLAGGTAVVAFLPVGLIAWIDHRPEVAAFVAAYVGAVLAFLCFNRHPARIWMGDTGSLAMGAVLALVNLLARTDLLLLLFGVVFVIDALTVLLQVGWFKTTGRRIFRMAPIHHGLELRGWSEVQIVTGAWLLQTAVSAVGIALWMLCKA